MNIRTRYKAICHFYYFAFGLVGLGILPAVVRGIEDTYGFSTRGCQSCLQRALFRVSGYVKLRGWTREQLEDAFKIAATEPVPELLKA